MNDNPRVTVFIPTYNYASYLPEAIESVLEQDFGDFELIIADDASSDDTVEVCRSYIEKDKRIRFYCHDKNKGMVENWNWCMQQAKGTYLKPMLADDRFNGTHALGLLVAALDENLSTSIAVSSRLIIDGKGSPIGVDGPLGLKNRVFSRTRLMRRILNRASNMIGEPTAVLFRRQQAGRMFDCSYRQLVDLEMWFHLLEQGDLVYFAEPLCCFRKHALQQTEVNKAGNVGAMESVRLLKRYADELDKRSLFIRVYHLRRPSNKQFSEQADELRSRLSTLDYVGQLIAHKITRPFQNLRSSFLKRRHRAGFRKILNQQAENMSR